MDISLLIDLLAMQCHIGDRRNDGAWEPLSGREQRDRAIHKCTKRSLSVAGNRLTNSPSSSKMDSQVTLVDANVLPDRTVASSILLFSQDSLLNATLYLRGTMRPIPVYKVQSTTNTSRTEVHKIIPGSDQEPPLVIRINRSEILPDKITFSGIPTLKTNQWLKKNTFTDP